ncbi:aminotransferase class IV [Brevibacterium sp. LE-L]|uniref:aminotransferase class IV n=1 Tax=Brevibacterium sp. LE-L TaxID=3418557 RepID=UPI003CE917C0
MSAWLWNPRERRFDEPTGDISAWTLLAADSWFVEDGRVRAFERHQARFGDAAAQVGGSVTGDFWAAAVEKIPETGEWFPRVDVLRPSPGEAPRLAFRLRPAPKRTRELRVLVPSHPDPRKTPGRKGPDIGLLGRLLAEARADCDCSEMLLLSEDGVVIEGATTSLLWWDGDTLCAPAPDLGTLPGVTSAVILDEARARSILVEHRRTRPEDLADCEVWLVNALHGIRRVQEFVDARDDGIGDKHGRMQRAATGSAGRAAVAVERFKRWREWTDAARAPLSVYGEESS